MTLPRLFALLSLLPACLQAGWLFPDRELEVIMNTETTQEGRLYPAPTPEKPVYYIAFDMGYKELGGIMGGDKVPTRKQMNDVLVKVLAKQGYLPASNKNPPTQALIWYWGSLYVEEMPSFDVNMPARQRNLGQMLRFLGGGKLNMLETDPFSTAPYTGIAGINLLSADQGNLLEVAKDDLYVISIGSYSFESMKTKTPKCLWRTKISAPSRGFVMAETLPKVAVLAGPNIGKETSQPVWVSVDSRLKAEVKIGDFDFSQATTQKELPTKAEEKPAKTEKPASK